VTTRAAQIACPNCRSPLQAPLTQLIDVRSDPAAKTRLLSGSLNFVRCPVCGYQGQLATPLVYHDPDKELLLTYMPVELSLPKDDQERLLGRLINQSIDRLPAEQRKGYLLRPQAVLTMQGLVERVLEADGITREQLDAQRAKLRLFEELLRIPPEQVAAFVAEHDAQLDAGFFQLASLSLGSTPDQRAREAGASRLDQAIQLTSYGKQLQAQEAELRSAAESLQRLGEGLTREKLLDLIAQAPNRERVRALVSLARPGLDYGFFQALSERIAAAKPPESERLTALRSQLLELTEEIDKAQQARVERAAALLESVMNAADLDQAVQAALPWIDELFLSILRANLRAAREASDEQAQARLQQIEDRINQAVLDSLPPGLRLAQRLLQAEDEAEAERLLDQSAAEVDEDTLNALLSASQRLEGQDEGGAADRLRRLHRLALRQSMRAKLGS
jgi:hypothetical protein